MKWVEFQAHTICCGVTFILRVGVDEATWFAPDDCDDADADIPAERWMFGIYAEDKKP